ncbi:DUF4886 domain-containing protein [Anaeromicropila herbilytica]|uniref:DUF4886 domain-containing protein n=1 Tax=Anaeromicropila herbilytica TaxID=2785025 RepID=A0A7R7EJY0_9FIRM|nr:DUF4886 domain-containing protein [Anaeromicropila herbilytica]BCN30065.1 hypothetical protein bsdtb5_13600 [Anaeromicropila herbilytica]
MKKFLLPSKKSSYPVQKHLLNTLAFILIVVLTLGYSLSNGVDSIKTQAASKKLIKKKVLFVGNSFTYKNDLPNMFKKLALSGGYNITIGSSTYGGYTLLQHSDADDEKGKITLSKITSKKWDYVVLQEQSQFPAYDNLREEMYEGARKLDKVIKDNESTPIFFMTWGYKNGDTYNSVDATKTFEGMQEQIQIGYETIADELSDQISPVGIAWLNAYQTYPNINLWAADNKHPSIAGTYLTACVMYETLLGKSPVGLEFTYKLSIEKAKALQEIAHNTCAAYIAE